ncbi:MAG: hypothetical protein GKR86_01005 [Ilumatobacter sp.]|nr:hypothetical protein [Ilumatobacter sp.]
MEDRLGTAMSAKKNTSLGELIEHCSTTLAAQREINSRLASSLCRINGPFPTEHLGEDVERSKPSGDLELLRCLVNDLDQEQKRTMDMLEILSGV